VKGNRRLPATGSRALTAAGDAADAAEEAEEAEEAQADAHPRLREASSGQTS
jgi:hypothetical protein